MKQNFAREQETKKTRCSYSRVVAEERAQTDWNPFLRTEFAEEYWSSLQDFVAKERKHNNIYPPQEEVFHALHATSLANTKVVILGQDPYHQQGQAHGLCFSVRRGVRVPPSLANIYKELRDDIGVPIANHGCLEKWAAQGVLLLNTTLTVREGAAGSHVGRGWERFTDRVLEVVNAKTTPVVFILWGSNARKKKALITNPAHLVIESVHPSPLSAHNGFFGHQPFSRTNEFLELSGLTTIDWKLD